jgi:hypothetical protein
MVVKHVSYINGKSRLMVFEKMIPRANYWAQKGENREWRRLNNEEIHSYIIHLI